MTNSEKVTIQKLYDLVIPIKETIAILVTKVESIDKNIMGIYKDNEDEHDKLEKKISTNKKDSISIKAFATWISITVVIITIIITILEKVIK